jgi:hypothetical protein
LIFFSKKSYCDLIILAKGQFSSSSSHSPLLFLFAFLVK